MPPGIAKKKKKVVLKRLHSQCEKNRAKQNTSLGIKGTEALKPGVKRMVNTDQGNYVNTVYSIICHPSNLD